MNLMSDTIGDSLKQAREQRGLTIEQVAGATRIRSHYLQALERNDLSVLPSTAQARGFLRIYAGHLGLDVDELLAAARPSLPVEPSADLPPAAVAIPAAPSPRPGFLSGLRDRFLRRTHTEPQKESKTESPAAASEPAPIAEPLQAGSAPAARQPAEGRRKKPRTVPSEKKGRTGTTTRKMPARGKPLKDGADRPADSQQGGDTAAADEKKKMT